MAGVKESYFESPTYAGFSSYAFSFFFSGRIQSAGKATPDNIRLAAARSALISTSGAAYSDLIQPTQSFFSDILATEIPLQRRPLIVACEPEVVGDVSRRVTLIRPKEFHYFAEGRDVTVENDNVEIPFEFRDVFGLFESGHLFYVLSLIPAGARVNEYHIISLQKLVNPTEDTEHLRESIRLRSPDGKARTLVEFVEWRHAQLAASERPSSAIRDILRKFMSKDEKLPAYGWASLKSLLIALEDAELFNQIKGTPDQGASIQSSRELRKPHMPADTAPRLAKLFALAGIVQGVADFPFQDESEISDSLVPIVDQSDAVVFAHPRFLIEVGPVWRSLTQMRQAIGSCPYVLLTHMALAYNQHILENVEQEVERLIYDVTSGDPIRANALGYLQKMVQGVERGNFRNQKLMLKASLVRRVAIYRDLILSRLPNIFRYPRERDVFERVSASYALERRYANCLELLGHYDALSSDVHSLSSLITDRAMNLLLFAISAISALSIVSVGADLIGVMNAAPEARVILLALWALLAFGVGVFALLRFVLWALR